MIFCQMGILTGLEQITSDKLLQILAKFLHDFEQSSEYRKPKNIIYVLLFQTSRSKEQGSKIALIMLLNMVKIDH